MKQLLLLCCLMLQEPRAREVQYEDGRAIPVEPAIATVNRHATCSVTFPEESIESIVAAWNESDISIERKSNILFLKLLRPVEGDLHVLGSSGTLYRLAIRPGTDSSVRIVRPGKREAPGSPALEFIRAMRLARVPADATVRRGKESVLYRIGATEAKCRWVYENTSYLGYVLEVTNPGGTPHRIDPSRLKEPRLILAGAREQVLQPKASTLLYLVFSRTP